jgi:tetratricopeptide (TPR) repeat protein
MNTLPRCSYFFAYMFLLVILSSCKSGTNKSGQSSQGADTINKTDTVTDVRTILSKSESLIADNKLEDATNYISARLNRCHGADKAVLLNERGTTYFLRDDFENAVADYLSTVDIEPKNPVYLYNVAKTYEELESRNNASFFAKKILDLNSATDSDRLAAQNLIQRCDRLNFGH